jgi:hypothetical protein
VSGSPPQRLRILWINSSELSHRYDIDLNLESKTFVCVVFMYRSRGNEGIARGPRTTPYKSVLRPQLATAAS